MKVQINGQEKDVSASTVAELVEQLGLKGDRVAIELNLNIVPRAKWPETPLKDGDKLEMVHFVGGGADWLVNAHRSVFQILVSLFVGIGIAAIAFGVVDQMAIVRNGGAQAMAENGVALAADGLLSVLLAASAGLVGFVSMIVWFSFKNRRKEQKAFVSR